MSERLTPAAATLISTSPRPGVGSGNSLSVSASRPPNRGRVIAFMAQRYARWHRLDWSNATRNAPRGTGAGSGGYLADRCYQLSVVAERGTPVPDRALPIDPGYLGP